MGLKQDVTLATQTKKMCLSSKPDSPEALWTKYKVMGNLWLPAQVRQASRKMYQDFTTAIFDKHLETLLSKENFFLTEKRSTARPFVLRYGHHCLEYEFHIRQEAIRLCRDEDWAIQAALACTLEKPGASDEALGRELGKRQTRFPRQVAIQSLQFRSVRSQHHAGKLQTSDVQFSQFQRSSSA